MSSRRHKSRSRRRPRAGEHVDGRQGTGRTDRKTQQLCRQVSHTLNYVLSGELHDDVLRSLYVESIVPAPDASRLLVTVSNLDRDDQTPIDVILSRLAAVNGKLRSEVAASISRRRTPELIFNVVRPEENLAPLPEEADRVNEPERDGLE